MGVVYRGRDALLERAVAIKTILMTFPQEDHEGYLARFRQEARALGALNHPSIVTVYDYGDEGDIAYMALELLEGRELRDVMAQARLEVPPALELAAQVAEGLAFAHARGVVHRDIKPGNIMVVDGPRAKIMDFGIARVRASDVKTQTGLMLGSPKYMSPEQIVGQPTDARSDVFSLGVVIYEMLTGAAPFSGTDIPQLMYQVCNARPDPPSRLNPGVPEVLDLVVAKALEKDPAARYQDAGELAADLRSAAAAGSPAPRATRPAADEATQPMQPAAATTIEVAPRLGLLPWRRFDSTRALARLANPRGDDRLLLAPMGPRPGGWVRLRADAMPLAAIAAATAAALLIALA
jgi:serine/threonine-protein kinase